MLEKFQSFKKVQLSFLAGPTCYFPMIQSNDPSMWHCRFPVEPSTTKTTPVVFFNTTNVTTVDGYLGGALITVLSSRSTSFFIHTNQHWQSNDNNFICVNLENIYNSKWPIRITQWKLLRYWCEFSVWHVRA